MATKTFGNKPDNTADFPQQLINKLHKLVGEEFPITVHRNLSTNEIAISYETEWKVGGTEPVETENSDGEKVITYRENYQHKKLTKDQVEKLDAEIEKIIQRD